MERNILVGTAAGLWEVDAAGSRSIDALAGADITALASGRRTWVLADGHALWSRESARPWKRVSTIEGPPGTCLGPTAAGLLIGTEQAHLLQLRRGRLTPVAAFERVEDRKAWYTPWGDPADVRSIAAGRGGAMFVNVHVGGVVRSRDRGRAWTPTLDIEKDVHQVIAHPSRRGVVLVAAAVGLGVSTDGGDSWRFFTAGLHARYSRAVALAGDTILLTASTGPSGRRAAIYRKPLDGDATFERCQRGLPAWFDDNIDTGCLAASGLWAVFGTEDGRIFCSSDGGVSWELLAKGLPAVRCLAFT